MADRIGVISKGEIILVDDKVELMRKLGSKQLTLHLQAPLQAIPDDDSAAGKAEALAALVQVIIITVSAVFIGFRAVQRLLRGAETAQAELGIGVSIVAMVLTMGLITYQRHVVSRTCAESIRLVGGRSPAPGPPYHHDAVCRRTSAGQCSNGSKECSRASVLPMMSLPDATRCVGVLAPQCAGGANA